MNDGRIRSASLADTREVSRLVARATAADVGAWLDHGHVLVLDRHDGTLGAVARVAVRDGYGTLDLLVVDPGLADRGIEQRMSGVAHALCEAFGTRPRFAAS
jgi:hypothetical protein